MIPGGIHSAGDLFIGAKLILGFGREDGYEDQLRPLAAYATLSVRKPRGSRREGPQDDGADNSWGQNRHGARLLKR